MRVILPQRLTLFTFGALYHQLYRLSPSEPVQLDMIGLKWTEPAGLLPLACVLRNHMAGGGALTVERFPVPDVCSYLERMNFYRLLARECPHRRRARRTADDRFIEITEVGVPLLSEKVKTKLGALVERRVEIRDATGKSFLTACGELVQNTRHAYNIAVEPQAECWPNALIQGQYYEKSNSLHFCVADCGIGIRRSLGAKDPTLYKTDKEAIDAALVLGMRGITESGKGLGLAAIRRFMVKNRGQFSIRTRGCFAVLSPYKRFANVPTWKGTVVALEIRGGRAVDISAIIKKFSKG